MFGHSGPPSRVSSRHTTRHEEDLVIGRLEEIPLFVEDDARAFVYSSRGCVVLCIHILEVNFTAFLASIMIEPVSFPTQWQNIAP